MKRLLLGSLALAVGACATVPAPQPVAPLAVAAAIPNGDQWLYGSAEASAAAVQTYRLLTDYVVRAAHDRPASSVILSSGSSPTGTGPLTFEPCGSKPLAVVFDADETLIWNVPPARYNLVNKGGSFDPGSWNAWEQTGAGHAKPVPGVIEALAAIRAAGITPIVNTNRSAANAAGTEATLKAAGIGEFVHGRTLFLSGDDATGSSKDQRRQTIAQSYCVIAMAGDQLGDFSNAFNVKGLPRSERLRAAISGPAAVLWGHGWFLLPNPSYGPWATHNLDDVYGPKEWAPEGTK